MITRECSVCGNSVWKTFWNSPGNKQMTSDQRIVLSRLEKISCIECGVVTNKNKFTSEELKELYGEKYILNVLDSEEHIFYTDNGPIARSEIYYQWIKPFIFPGSEIVLEIGCGEGNLLSRLSTNFNDKTFIGYDGSFEAIALGRKKGLNVSQKIIFHEDDLLISADVIILIGVLEHIEDPFRFLNILIRALNNKGRLILCVPIQNHRSCDIFFGDHIWHFTHNQFQNLLNRCSLNVIFSEINHPINHNFGLYVCEVGAKINLRPQSEIEIQNENLEYWLSVFIKFDHWMGQQIINRIAIFGSGEIFTLFYAFTSLGSKSIIACLDDTKTKQGTFKHGIPVKDPSWLEANKVDVLLLAINTKYNEQVIKTYHICEYTQIAQV